MPRKAKILGALAVSRLTKPGFHFVGEVAGLALMVGPLNEDNSPGGRSWVLRATIAGKRCNMGLGGYPDVTLAGARDAARAARAKIDAGIDPIAERIAARAALRAAEPVVVVKFRDAAASYIAIQEPGWASSRTFNAWTNTIETYANPFIGNKDVSEVSTDDMLAILQPIWADLTETAGRLRGRIEEILDWAKVKKLRTGENPARWKGHLDKLLIAPSKIVKVVHHKALPIDDVPAFMKRLRATDGVVARALEFQILTVVRTGDTRGFVFTELSTEENMWIIPVARLKNKQAKYDHRVPLCERAMQIVAEQPRFVGSPYVFTGEKGSKIGDNMMINLVRDMKVDAVPHGFRSTFKDWASERTNYQNEVSEMALAHAIKGRVESAYRRGDLYEKRVLLMNDWAAYCAG